MTPSPTTTRGPARRTMVKQPLLVTLALGELMMSEERVQSESRLSGLRISSLAITWHGSTEQMRRDYKRWALNPVATRAAASRALYQYQKQLFLIAVASWNRSRRMRVRVTTTDSALELVRTCVCVTVACPTHEGNEIATR